MRRLVLIALALSLPAAIAVFVPVWRYGVVKGTAVHIAGQHPATTPQERAAAAVALYFVRAAQRGDARAACTVAVRRAARQLRCAKTPRLPRILRLGSKTPTAFDTVVGGGIATIVVSDGSGKANFLRMHRWHGIWRVAKHTRGYTI